MQVWPLYVLELSTGRSAHQGSQQFRMRRKSHLNSRDDQIRIDKQLLGQLYKVNQTVFEYIEETLCETLMTYIYIYIYMETFVWYLLTTRLFFSIMQRLINLLFLLLCISFHLCTLKIICKFYILYSKKFDTEPCWHPKPPSNSLSFFIFIYKLLHDIRKAFSLHALWLLNLQMSSLI